MIEYFFCDSNGRILQSGVCPTEEALALQSMPGATLIRSVGAMNLRSENSYYDFVSQTIIQIPAPPSEYHAFSWSLKTWVLPDAALFQARVNRKAAIDAARDAALAMGTVSYGGHLYQVDRASRDNISATVTAAQAGLALPSGFAWRTADNVNVPFALADLVALGGLALGFWNAQYQRSWAAKSAIDAATTVDAVLAVNF